MFTSPCWFYLWKGSCKQSSSYGLWEWGRLDFLQGGSWTGGENFAERFVLPAAVRWDTSRAPHTYGACCLSRGENKTPSLSGFVQAGKCLLSSKKMSRVFPASTLQKAGCRRAAAHLLLGPRGDRENHGDVTWSPGVRLETMKSWRLCNICDIKTEESRERWVSIFSATGSTHTSQHQGMPWL